MGEFAFVSNDNIIFGTSKTNNMSAKKKESSIEKIITQVAIAVISALLIAYFSGVFNLSSAPNTTPTTVPTNQNAGVKPGEGRG